MWTIFIGVVVLAQVLELKLELPLFLLGLFQCCALDRKLGLFLLALFLRGLLSALLFLFLDFALLDLFLQSPESSRRSLALFLKFILLLLGLISEDHISFRNFFEEYRQLTAWL